MTKRSFTNFQAFHYFAAFYRLDLQGRFIGLLVTSQLSLITRQTELALGEWNKKLL